MTDRPILFSAPMVRALLAATKTQTRRVIPQPEMTAHGWHIPWQVGGGVVTVDRSTDAEMVAELLNGLRIQPGDRLWVREAFSYETLDVDRCGFMPPWYWADGNPVSGDFTKPKPSIHMPRWASRLTLVVTDVRVQRLQDISEEDARAEGCDQALADAIMGTEELVVFAATHIVAPHARARIIFETLWEQINGPDAWATNPWVAAYTFTVHQQNIDSPTPSPAEHPEGGGAQPVSAQKDTPA